MGFMNGRQAFCALSALLVVDVVAAGGLEGKWTGTFVQGPQRYPVEVSFAPSGSTVAYPSFRCTGKLVLAQSDGKTFRYTERIERGSCTPGKYEFTSSGSDSLSYKYYDNHNNLYPGVLKRTK
jgi:hypothetical protein